MRESFLKPCRGWKSPLRSKGRTGPVRFQRACMPFAVPVFREFLLCSACCAWRLLWESRIPKLWISSGPMAGEREFSPAVHCRGKTQRMLLLERYCRWGFLRGLQSFSWRLLHFTRTKQQAPPGWRLPTVSDGAGIPSEALRRKQFCCKVGTWCCFSCWRQLRGLFPNRAAQRAFGYRAPGFCRQAMRRSGWYAGSAAVNWPGLLSALW